MGVRARLLLGVALLSCAACKATSDPSPGVGTPGLEPPSMARDGGVPGPGLEPPSGSSGQPMTPGDSTGSPGFAGSGGSATGGGGTGGAGGASGQPPESEDLDGGAESGPGDALFTGLWVIDQPSHAGYEATLYELSADGQIGELETMLFGAEPWPGYATGTVANTDGSVRCQFAGGWRSLEARVIELDAFCTDGAARAARIELPADQDVTAGVTPIVRSVEGQGGWDHRDWPWSWRKCSSRDDCPPF